LISVNYFFVRAISSSRHVLGHITRLPAVCETILLVIALTID